MASKRILSKTLLATLLLSLGANLYLVLLVVQWQEAWTQQILTTANLERLYRHSGADTSYAALRRCGVRLRRCSTGSSRPARLPIR